VKNKLSQLTFSFLKNPSLNLLAVNPLTPTERNRWYLAWIYKPFCTKPDL